MHAQYIVLDNTNLKHVLFYLDIEAAGLQCNAFRQFGCRNFPGIALVAIFAGQAILAELPIFAGLAICAVFARLAIFAIYAGQAILALLTIFAIDAGLALGPRVALLGKRSTTVL